MNNFMSIIVTYNFHYTSISLSVIQIKQAKVRKISAFYYTNLFCLFISRNFICFEVMNFGAIKRSYDILITNCRIRARNDRYSKLLLIGSFLQDLVRILWNQNKKPAQHTVWLEPISGVYPWVPVSRFARTALIIQEQIIREAWLLFN